MARGSHRSLWPRRLHGGWLAPQALVIVEEAADAEFALPPGFRLIEERGQSDTKVIFAAVE